MSRTFSRLALCGFVMLLMACTPVAETEATPVPAPPPVYRMTFGDRYAIVADPVTGCQYIRYQAGSGHNRVAAMVPRYEWGGGPHETYSVRGCGRS